jgi:deazaflavin-dependent oxidoreductase (nitroreductase family)
MAPARVAHATSMEWERMDSQIRRALASGGIIDITTTGRRTGAPRRIEIVFHAIDGRIYITGRPRADRTRAWLLNLEADPHLTFHLKGAVSADLPATARVVTDEAERRAVFGYVVTVWTGQDLETMVRHSPLIEVTIDDQEA